VSIPERAGREPRITSPPVPEQEEAIDPTERARAMTEFFGPRVPGQLGCVFDHAGRDLVLGHIDVTDNLIAGTGYLFAPAVVALADTCAAIGCGGTTPEGASFTTIELKTNFLATARDGALRCGARLIHGGGRTQVWDANVSREQDERVIALFRCTQFLLPKEDVRTTRQRQQQGAAEDGR
jgi:1,4-dihydroxy-2-naphthoyl-CoA hydrolase